MVDYVSSSDGEDGAKPFNFHEEAKEIQSDMVTELTVTVDPANESGLVSSW